MMNRSFTEKVEEGIITPKLRQNVQGIKLHGGSHLSFKHGGTTGTGLSLGMLRSAISNCK